MREKFRLRDLDINIGKLPVGKNNAITDVKGVRVGSTTIIKGEGELVPGQGPIRTGVTIVLPHSGNVFEEKVPAGSFVLNGYGKTSGLVQIAELGTLESPIALTNTLNVPKVADALIDYTIENNPEIGIKTSTVNVVVTECNDGFLNDIQGRHVNKEHVFQAINKASESVLEGGVGAGTGMIAMGFKSGIGTASRLIEDKEAEYTIGALVLPNFGRPGDLIIHGKNISPNRIPSKYSPEDEGSIIVILATDAPLSSRQLIRLSKRGALGISRAGGFATHGSGDIIVAFSNAYTISDDRSKRFLNVEIVNEQHKLFNLLLKGAVEVTQEAIYNALTMAETMIGRDYHFAEGLSKERILEYLDS